MLSQQGSFVPAMMVTIFMLSSCIAYCYCDGDTLYNRGTVAYSHQINNSKSDDGKSMIDHHPQELQDIEDKNELHQIQETDTATLLSKEVDEDSPAVVQLTHSKHHLWKLRVANLDIPTIPHGKNITNDSSNTNNGSHSSRPSNVSVSSSSTANSQKHSQENPGSNPPQELRNAIVKERENPEQSTLKPGCRSCMLNSQLEASLDSESLRKMRLEVIKEQILKKLGLKEPPNTTFLAKETIPLPVALGSTLTKRRHPHLRNRDRDVDDFYGKTEQVIVFPEEAMPRCVTHRTDPSSCFTFKLPQEKIAEKVSTAELWVYKLQDGKDGRNQSFWVDEISLSQTDINHSTIRARNIDIKHDIPFREGWLKLNLTRTMPKWLSSNVSEHALQVGCKTCTNDLYQSPVDTEGDQRPFIVINYNSSPVKKRNRRSINCSSQLKECCRESFEVSFKEIGWDQWIIAPKFYNAYYCKGSCVTSTGGAHSKAQHTTVMQNYIGRYGITNKTLALVPCCTATKMSPISLIFRDSGPDNVNRTRSVKTEILPNMIVESCGCL